MEEESSSRNKDEKEMDFGIFDRIKQVILILEKEQGDTPSLVSSLHFDQGAKINSQGKKKIQSQKKANGRKSY